MSTQTTKKTGDAASNGKAQARARASTDAEIAATKKDAQDAQQAEATGGPRTFEFDGYTYEILEGQPSPKATTYVARWAVDDENLAMVLAIREILGEAQWELWCNRHRSDQMDEFWLVMNKAAGGGEGN